MCTQLAVNLTIKVYRTITTMTKIHIAISIIFDFLLMPVHQYRSVKTLLLFADYNQMHGPFPLGLHYL